MVIAIKTIPLINIPIPINKMIAEPINATLLTSIFFSNAKSTNMQVSFLRFLILKTKSSKHIRQPRPQPTGANTKASLLKTIEKVNKTIETIKEIM